MNQNIGHHANPRRASATAPLPTGAGKSKGAKTKLGHIRSRHDLMDDLSGRRGFAKAGGRAVHAAQD